jgi:hypothetical protein
MDFSGKTRPPEVLLSQAIFEERGAVEDIAAQHGSRGLRLAVMPTMPL